jgi:hypothetical protein
MKQIGDRGRGVNGAVDWIFVGLKETCDLVGRKVLYNVLKLNPIMFMKV